MQCFICFNNDWLRWRSWWVWVIIFELRRICCLFSIDNVNRVLWHATLTYTWSLWYLLLEFILLSLLHHHLMLIELLNCIAVDFLEKIWGLAYCRLAMMSVIRASILIWLLFNPKIFRWLEIIPKNRNNFLNLIVWICVHKEIRIFLLSRLLFSLS